MGGGEKLGVATLTMVWLVSRASIDGKWNVSLSAEYLQCLASRNAGLAHWGNCVKKQSTERPCPELSRILARLRCFHYFCFFLWKNGCRLALRYGQLFSCLYHMVVVRLVALFGGVSYEYATNHSLH